MQALVFTSELLTLNKLLNELDRPYDTFEIGIVEKALFHYIHKPKLCR
jgi:hypothetical protein